ncbi:MAG: hypothetical protein AB7Q16_18200 [Vicinamibacterales bacterium]
MTTTLHEGVQLVESWRLDTGRPWNRLLVWTVNTRYVLHAVDAAHLVVRIRGGRFFTEARRARVAGARQSATEIRPGTIHVGLPLELHADGRVIITSPVRRIEFQGPGSGSRSTEGPST